MCVGETEDGLSYSERQARKARGKSTDLIFCHEGARGKVPTLFFCHEWVRVTRFSYAAVIVHPSSPPPLAVATARALSPAYP